MIFYTLQGPSFELEIHEDKLQLIKKPWWKFFGRPKTSNSWKITELSNFQITVPKFLFISGKIEWQTFDGTKGTFRFDTNPAMVKKIETYLQKRVIKNHQEAQKSKKLPSPKGKRELSVAA